MKKISIITCADYDFQIIQIVDGDSVKAWDIANEMFEDGTFKKHNIDHYDVFEFDTLSDLNIWVLEQILISNTKRKLKTRSNSTN